MHRSAIESEIALRAEDFAHIVGVSSEVMTKLSTYLQLLEKWQARFNLVGGTTLEDPWRRHFLDSAQLRTYLDQTDGSVVDLGTGAGFPGLVLSLIGQPHVQLVDSDANKIEFLRQVILNTESDAILHRTRIEQYSGPAAASVISRACTSLDALLGFASTVCATGAKAVFLKGKTWRDELTHAQTLWHIDVQCHSSLTDPNSVVLEIHEFKRR